MRGFFVKEFPAAEIVFDCVGDSAEHLRQPHPMDQLHHVVDRDKWNEALSKGSSIDYSSVGAGSAVKNAPTKGRGHEVDHQLRGATAFVEKRIEFNDVH